MPRKRDPSKPVGPTPLVLEGEAKRKVMDHICAELSEGRFLRVICREDPGMPSHRTVHDWRYADPQFEMRYQAARDEGFDARAERSSDLLRTEPNRIKTEYGDKIDPAHVQWLKNQADHELKLLAKWSPRYGERVTQEVVGAGGGPVQTVTRIELVALTDGSDPSPD